MSRLKKTQLEPEKDVPVRQRMALFQLNSEEREDTRGGRRGRGGVGERGTRGAADKGRGAGGEDGATSLRPPPKITQRPPNSPTQTQIQGLTQVSPSPCPSSNTNVHLYTYASHCDSLFSALRGLQGEGLLTDCDLHLHGNLLRFHWVVLAAVSERVEAWLRAGKAGLAEAQQHLSGGHVTVAGLRAVLDFAYGGEMLGSSAEGGALEDVMSACRCRL